MNQTQTTQTVKNGQIHCSNTKGRARMNMTLKKALNSCNACGKIDYSCNTNPEGYCKTCHPTPYQARIERITRKLVQQKCKPASLDLELIEAKADLHRKYEYEVKDYD